MGGMLWGMSQAFLEGNRMDRRRVRVLLMTAEPVVDPAAPASGREPGGRPDR
jgi:hypothetical protein